MAQQSSANAGIADLCEPLRELSTVIDLDLACDFAEHRQALGPALARVAMPCVFSNRVARLGIDHRQLRIVRLGQRDGLR